MNQITKKGIVGLVAALVLGVTLTASPHVASASIFSDFFDALVGTTKTSTVQTSKSATPPTDNPGTPFVTPVGVTYGTPITNISTGSTTQQFTFTFSMTAANDPVYLLKSAYYTLATSTPNPAGIQIISANFSDNDSSGDTSGVFYIAPGQTKKFTAVYLASGLASNSGVVQISAIKYGTSDKGPLNSAVSSPAISNSLKAVLFGGSGGPGDNHPFATIDNVKVSFGKIPSAEISKGKTYTITWNESNTTQSVDIHLYRFVGTKFNDDLDIGNVRAIGHGTNSITWNVPSDLKIFDSQYQIYVHTLSANSKVFADGSTPVHFSDSKQPSVFIVPTAQVLGGDKTDSYILPAGSSRQFQIYNNTSKDATFNLKKSSALTYQIFNFNNNIVFAGTGGTIIITNSLQKDFYLSKSDLSVQNEGTITSTPGSINCPAGSTNCTPTTPPNPITATSACYAFSKYLTVGDAGVDVTALQTFLINRGYLVLPAGTAKGYFGDSTKAAVMAFQTHENIVEPTSQSGSFIVGPLTLAKMNASCNGANPDPVTTPSAIAQPSITITSPNGGEVWIAGQTYPIRWTASNLPSNTSIYFQLSYRTKDGTTYEDGFDVNPTSNTGVFNWTVPTKYLNMQPGYFKLRALLTGPSIPSTNGPQDYSNNYFTISYPTPAPSYSPTPSPSTSPVSTTPVITSIESTGNPRSTISSNEYASLYGTGLGGRISVRIGSSDPIYTTGSSDTYAHFLVPQLPSGSPAVYVTNSSGKTSAGYIVTLTNPIVTPPPPSYSPTPTPSVSSVVSTPITLSCQGYPSTSGSPYVKWQASASGGNNDYVYAWSAYNDVATYGNGNGSATFLVYYNTPGAKQAAIHVTSGGSTATATCSSSIAATSPAQTSSGSGTPSPVSEANPSGRSVAATVLYSIGDLIDGFFAH